MFLCVEILSGINYGLTFQLSVRQSVHKRCFAWFSIFVPSGRQQKKTNCFYFLNDSIVSSLTTCLQYTVFQILEKCLITQIHDLLLFLLCNNARSKKSAKHVQDIFKSWIYIQFLKNNCSKNVFENRNSKDSIQKSISIFFISVRPNRSAGSGSSEILTYF